MEEITLDKVLSYKNAEGKPYMTDIMEWIPNISFKEARKIQDKLVELQERL